MTCGEGCACGAPVVAETFDTKLEQWEEYARLAHRYLIDWLRDDAETLIAGARGRVAWGHYRYGDSLMYELGPEELCAEAAMELFDALNYVNRLLFLADQQAAKRPVRRCVP